MSQQKNQNMRKKPFYFQELSLNNGLRILNESNGLLLSSETGLGKTIVAIEIAHKLQLKTLIVSPKQMQKEWRDLTTGIDVTICGNRSFPEGDYGLIIIDEVHRIGGAASYLNLCKLIKPKTKVIAISATPYNNDVGSICDIIALLNLKGYARYIADAACTNLCITASKLDKLNRFFGENSSFQKINEKVEIELAHRKNMETLAKALPLFTIRDERGKIPILEHETVLQYFPKKATQTISYEAENYEVLYSTYKIFKKLTFAWQNQLGYFFPNVDASFGGVYQTTLYKLLESSKSAFLTSIKNSKATITSALQKRELVFDDVTHPFTDSFANDLSNDLELYNQLIELWEPIQDKNKPNALFDAIASTNGKSVVFCEYVETAKFLANEAKERGIKYILFTNESNEDLLDVIDSEFNANNHTSDKYELLICNDILAEGVSLHYAKTLVHYDNRWNPSRMIQREGRIDRICTNGNLHDINVFYFEVPGGLDNELKLTEKIERKTYEADMLFSQMDYVVPTLKMDKIVIDSVEQAIESKNHFSENDAYLLVFKNETEFVAYEVNEVFMFMGGYPTREAQLEPGSYIVKPRQRYQIHEDRVHCPTTQFNTVTELWDATETYDRDMRIKGVITQNIESVGVVGYRNSEPTIRKINTSALNHARSVPVDKETYKALRQVFSGGMLCYPFGKIWNQLNTKVPKGMDTKEFITEQLSKLVEYGDPNQHPFFVIAELEKC